MKKYLFIPVILILLSFGMKNQTINAEKQKTFLIVSYNVENLFDTIDTPNKSDEEFTPESLKKWGTERYFKKINDIASVLADINPVHLPDLIGLIEVENRAVVEDLIHSDKLKKGNYAIVHQETSDPRGIDVALVYNPKVFKYISHCQIPIIDSLGKHHNTREILKVKGIISKDTVYVFVNHWKSRSGGAEKTEAKRILASEILRKSIDSVLKVNPKADIICLGDFNDTPSDISIEKYLNASTDSIFDSKKELFNLTAFQAKQGNGTNNYKNQWFLIDNMIVSQNMIKKSNNIHALSPARIYRSSLNIYYNSKANDSVPNRTFGGNSYFGGISDHLPVYDYFSMKK